MKKRILAFMIAALLVALCASCGAKTMEADTTAADTTAADSTAAVAQTETTAAPTEPQTDEPTSKQTAEETAAVEPLVSVREVLEDETLDKAAYDFFEAATDEMQTQIIFTANETVRDFKVLALSDVAFDDFGNIHFKTRELYTQPSLMPDRPLVVTTVFYGDIPNNGVSYVDAGGVTRKFAVDMSGVDGLLYLMPID